MKTTAFTQKHIDLGAKMVPFAGYNMPIEYVGIKDEHNAVRNNVGVFDVSHMGEFWVKGPNALAFCQYVTSNDVLRWFQVKYSTLASLTERAVLLMTFLYIALTARLISWL